MNILQILQNEFNIKEQHLQATIDLIDEGNTIPFIARYRKEMTGSLDDQVLRELFDRLAYLRNLNETRENYRKLITEMDKMTDEINAALDAAQTLAVLEDIYRPYRPKRRTRASIAKEKGLEPLALLIFEQDITIPVETPAEEYIDEEKGVATIEDAVAGAMDIIAEMISDDANYRAMIRRMTNESGVISSKATDPEKESVYEMYYDFTEPVKKCAGHRTLAMNRGENEDFLKITLEAPVDDILHSLNKAINKKNQYTDRLISDTIDDSYKRLIAPSIEREIRNDLTEISEEGALKVFAKNLRQLLLQAPIKDKTVLALDPGYRTGCKACIIDGIGNVLYTGVVYPTPPANKIAEAKKALLPQIEKHQVDIVAIGNGTASRETEAFTAEMLKETKRKVFYIIVNEAGASVYSASKLGADEFPEFDVALRSAVSIGRRLQDPLAELVKIDPKSIGVGQYQHDMNQKRLSEALGGVVESCVNSVGVDLNTASPSLLSYVAGISSTVSKNILKHREQNGKFKNRKELLSVKSLGPKAFEQCAGFLRIMDGDNPLDATGVHPESYAQTQKLLVHMGYSADDVKNRTVTALRPNASERERLASDLNIGIPTLEDILRELEKPGRDPREDAPAPILRSDVLSMEDLAEGMVLKGVVRNIIDFGAFVDIGVHQDGLVHISQMTNKFIKHPLEVVSVGDIVDVMVLGVDLNKKRISLTMKIPKSHIQ
ncbi:MAG: RNA-binding transcriptional accessory protein [Defluviitaleaceae bacterium]|nr:RNA-binding transcriptional accessory protein [Defluviitaleaceae bacterium]